MKITLINPNLVAAKHDFMATGIVYMPIGLVYTATYLKKSHNVSVIDTFAEAPKRKYERNGFFLFGTGPDQAAAKIDEDVDLIFFYADRLISHISLTELIKSTRKRFPSIPTAVFENTQAVTAYSLFIMKNVFYDMGVDYLVTGDPEERCRLLAQCLSERKPVNIQGVYCRKNQPSGKPQEKVKNDLDELPFPDWTLIPYENYWKIRYAHGPFQTDRYLPTLTSRGCPFNCGFCIMPATNDRSWRGRSAGNAVDEMQHYVQSMGVNEFHLEDANPTVNEARILEICREIKKRNLKVIWKLASGTKAESIKSESTLKEMRDAGCNYISISPESGSKRVLDLMNKPFDFEHGYNLVRSMRRLGIKSQACFIVGFPGETEEDRKETARVARKFIRIGIDEVIVSIIAPVPGSSIFDQYDGYKHISELNFSPIWRKDYSELASFRSRLYVQYITLKLIFNPFSLISQFICLLRRRFLTKMEMTAYRCLCYMFIPSQK